MKKLRMKMKRTIAKKKKMRKKTIANLKMNWTKKNWNLMTNLNLMNLMKNWIWTKNLIY